MDESTTNAGDGPALSPEQAFDLLSAQPRRYALYELRDRESLTVAELAREVESRMHDDPDDERVERLYLAFHHSHLPELEDEEIVERDDGIVELGERASSIEPYVRYAKMIEDGQ